uniref:Uncharacterized protein n=1 Tax=Chromera velia CCMP2878 TaxID=1169474 RepID=A0A0G4H0H9_9ALVE|eukprot:Cvel_24214.t1-p1 / transcript=Cvel_24214.t1 / gene=Cvel_24214 / organism=Chromera_velia_CCMP2878 / gene_product=hypothetical protein / transcript_product=hypothetical protein / location=Cvel_scaffold2588:10100-17172(+) / protein_length=632 / sequence_SO=supercontig / SO=protein_coding / is_pseudo=false
MSGVGGEKTISDLGKRGWLGKVCFELSGYETTKKVTLYSWRLKALLLSVYAVAIAYVVLTVLLYHGYARFEAASATFNPWVPMAVDVTQGDFAYCPAGSDTTPLPSSYDFAPDPSNFQASGGFMFKNVKCITEPNLAEQIRIPGNEVVVLTSRQEVLVGSPCNQIAQADISSETAAEATFFDRTLDDGTDCVQSFFLPGPENFIIYLIHAISISFDDDSSRLRNVPCTFKTPSGTRTFDKDVPITFTVAELVEAANMGPLGLDKLNPQLYAWDPERYPRYRHTGGSIIVRFNYRNLETSNLSVFDYRCEITASLQEGVWGYLGVEEEYDQDLGRAKTVSHFGLRIRFEAGGSLGTWDTTFFFQQLFNGLVLLLSAGVLTDYLGQFFFKNFRQYTSEKVKEPDLETRLNSRPTVHWHMPGQSNNEQRPLSSSAFPDHIMSDGKGTDSNLHNPEHMDAFLKSPQALRLPSGGCGGTSDIPERMSLSVPGGERETILVQVEEDDGGGGAYSENPPSEGDLHTVDRLAIVAKELERLKKRVNTHMINAERERQSFLTEKTRQSVFSHLEGGVEVAEENVSVEDPSPVNPVQPANLSNVFGGLSSLPSPYGARSPPKQQKPPDQMSPVREGTQEDEV